MPEIVFVEHDGTLHKVEAEVGMSVMEAAVQNGVNGIDADCGGSCACATCHGYIDDAWRERIPAADFMELDMLELAYERTENSRLTCQIRVNDDMNGLLIRLPESQG